MMLERRILEPREDLYTGHLMHPAFVSLHRDTMAMLKLKLFIGTGGGALLRGSTLRRLQSSGTLDAFIARQIEGDLRWSVLDWTLGLAMAAIDVTPRGHAVFQQFTGLYGDPTGVMVTPQGCHATWVSCHEFEKQEHFRVPASRGGMNPKNLERCEEHPNVDLPGHDLPVQCEGALPHVPCSAPSAAACRERCASRCRCFAYVYTPESVCYLKARGAANSSGVPWVPAPVKGFVSGRCAAPEPRCDEVAVNVRSHELAFRTEAMRKSFHLRKWATPCSSGDYGGKWGEGRGLDDKLKEPFSRTNYVSKCGVPRPGVDAPCVGKACVRDARTWIALQDVNLPGHDIAEQCGGGRPYTPCPAYSAAECRERCAARRCRCFAYVYTPEGSCYLRRRGQSGRGTRIQATFRDGWKVGGATLTIGTSRTAERTAVLATAKPFPPPGADRLAVLSGRMPWAKNCKAFRVFVLCVVFGVPCMSLPSDPFNSWRCCSRVLPRCSASRANPRFSTHPHGASPPSPRPCQAAPSAYPSCRQPPCDVASTLPPARLTRPSHRRRQHRPRRSYLTRRRSYSWLSSSPRRSSSRWVSAWASSCCR